MAKNVHMFIRGVLIVSFLVFCVFGLRAQLSSSYNLELSEKKKEFTLSFNVSHDEKIIGCVSQVGDFNRFKSDYGSKNEQEICFIDSKLNIKTKYEFLRSSGCLGLKKSIKEFISCQFKSFGDNTFYIVHILSRQNEEEIHAFRFNDGEYEPFNNEKGSLLFKINGDNPFHRPISQKSQFKLIILENKIVVTSLTNDIKKGESPIFKVVVFDSDLSEELNYTQTVKLPPGNSRFSTPFVNAIGELYFVCRVFNREAKKAGDKEGIYKLNFYKLTPQGSQVIEMGNDKQDVENMRIDEMSNGDVICIGFNENDDNSILFSAKFGENENDFHELTLSPERMKFPYNFKRGSKYSEEIPVMDHRFINSFSTKDGGIVFLSEEQLIKETPSAYFFYDQEIFITKLDKNGKLEWIGIIDKNQYSGEPLAPKSSFSMFHNYADDKLFLIFNDDKKNYDETGRVKEEIVQKNQLHKHDYLVVASINLTDGGIEQEAIHDNNTDKMDFIPSSSFSDIENGYLYGYFKKGIIDPVGKIGRIKLD